MVRESLIFPSGDVVVANLSRRVDRAKYRGRRYRSHLDGKVDNRLDWTAKLEHPRRLPTVPAVPGHGLLLSCLGS